MDNILSVGGAKSIQGVSGFRWRPGIGQLVCPGRVLVWQLYRETEACTFLFSPGKTGGWSIHYFFMGKCRDYGLLYSSFDVHLKKMF